MKKIIIFALISLLAISIFSYEMQKTVVFAENSKPMNIYSVSSNGSNPWPMFHHDIHHSGLSPYNTTGNNGEKRWELKTNGTIESSVAMSFDGTLYFGSNDGYLYAVKRDGTLKWKFDTGKPVKATPAIGTDGTIYFVSVNGYLYAVNPDHSLKWKFKIGVSTLSSPTVYIDGTIFVGSYNHYLYAINRNGTLKWKFKSNGVIMSSPAIGYDGTIYFRAAGGSSGIYIYALNPNGTLKWKYRTGLGYTAYSSPAVGPDGTIYFGAKDNLVYALNPNGKLKWVFQTGGIVRSTPAIGPTGIIYVGSNDGYLYAITQKGKLKWKYKTGECRKSSPAVSINGTIYIGGKEYLYALDSNGKLKWKLKLEPYYTVTSPIIDDGGTVYVCSGYTLYALGKRSPQKPERITVITLWPENPYMLVNGERREIDPGRGTKTVIIPKWSRTVVPIRAIVETLGGNIYWDGTERKVTIKFKGTTIELWIGNAKAKVNGETEWIDVGKHDVRPIIINDRTMLPLRFVVENLGCTVGWDPFTTTITITYPKT